MPSKRCRERTLIELLKHDGDPKVYPILPAPPGFRLVCVWTNQDAREVLGSYDDFQTEAAEYRERPRCLYFTVPGACPVDAS